LNGVGTFCSAFSWSTADCRTALVVHSPLDDSVQYRVFFFQVNGRGSSTNSGFCAVIRFGIQLSANVADLSFYRCPPVTLVNTECNFIPATRQRFTLGRRERLLSLSHPNAPASRRYRCFFFMNHFASSLLLCRCRFSRPFALCFLLDFADRAGWDARGLVLAS